MIRYLLLVLLAPPCLFCGNRLQAQVPKLTDWPLFGGAPSRNMVNLIDKNIPTDWSVEKGKEKNIKWTAKLGSMSYGGPILAGGRIFVGTNNAVPRDPKDEAEKSVMMCFDEKTGQFLWQTMHDAPKGQIFKDVTKYGLLSTPVVDSDRLYYVLPQSVVVCSDVKDGKILWQYDMHKELKVTPFHCSNCSPLVAEGLLFLVTGNGVDEQTDKMHDANAPSFIAIDTKTQKVVWKSNLPGDLVFQGQWSNPTYAIIQGKAQVIFAGGDGALYSFEPATGKLIWEFHSHPKKRIEKNGQRVLKNYIVATPVVHDNKVYVGMGVMPEFGGRPEFSYFLCIDATKTGDVSPGGLDAKAVQGKNSALVWSFGGSREATPEYKRKFNLQTTISTCAIHDGLVYIPEEDGYMHCLDAKTGQRVWTHDLVGDAIWGSPYYVDGKVYVCTSGREVVIYQAGRQLKVINKVDFDEIMHGTPVVCNGVLFIATPSTLYAIGEK